MNARIERVVNSENLSARIVENGGWNQKIWALEAFRGKMVFFGGSGAILDFLEWFEGLGTKYRGSCKVWRYFRDFCGSLEGLGGLRTKLELFFETEGPCYNFSKCTGTATQFTTGSGGFM
jgi:hypothetical protein